MLKAGRENQDFYAGLFKWISESVDAVKEIKIAGKENYFINEYSKCGNGYVNAVQKYTLYSSTPRLLIEWICVAGLVLYMVFEIMRGGTNLAGLVPQLGVFGLAAARLLPSANRINTYMTNISYFQPFLDNVSDNLQDEIHDRDISYRLEDYPASEQVEKLPVTQEIRLEHITYHYPNSDRYIFRDADAVFPVGKSVGIVGSSGGGKTTLIDIMLGLLRPESGVITADGVDVRTHYQGWLKNIGYIPQSIYMLDTTICRMRKLTMRRSGARCARPSWRSMCAPCRRGWTPRSASMASVFPADRDSGSASPGHSSRIRKCWCWMRRPPRSTMRRRRPLWIRSICSTEKRP